jgi:hypothetical protein
MFNPLHPFEPRFVKMFKAKGVKAFVKQTYKRGRPDFNKLNLEGFVLIHFDTLLAAQQYYDVQKTDPNRELLKLDSRKISGRSRPCSTRQRSFRC